MFGQTELFVGLPANFGLFFGELPTISTIQVNGTKSSVSKEQLHHSLDLNSTRYLDPYLRTLFDCAIQVHCLLWPTILYLLIVVVPFYFYQFCKFCPELLPPKKRDAKVEEMTMRIGRRVWNLCIVISLSVLVYELNFFVHLPMRFFFLGTDMVDCVMDGVQNVTQLQNQTHMATVRSCCAAYGIPPNYGNFSTNHSSLLMRVEPRNQTFVESVDYFLARQNENFNFKMSFANLITIPFLLVSYALDSKFAYFICPILLICLSSF